MICTISKSAFCVFACSGVVTKLHCGAVVGRLLQLKVCTGTCVKIGSPIYKQSYNAIRYNSDPVSNATTEWLIRRRSRLAVSKDSSA